MKIPTMKPIMKLKKSFMLSLIMVMLLWFGTGLAFGQANISGPTQIDKCDTGTYTITITNNSTENICNIIVTNTLPNADFTYVTNSSDVCLPDPGCGTCNVSNGNPAVSGNDLIWTLNTVCGSTVQLAPTESFTVTFDVSTNCDTVSGTNVVRVDYEECTAPGVGLWDDDSVSIQVNPGAVTIEKSPAVVNAGFNDVVSWDLIITNTGLGDIKNVVVTDQLGAGLAYVTDTHTGSVTGAGPGGHTVTWSSTEIGALALMVPDASVTITIQAQVIACQDLDNTADVRWGCDGGPTCFDTSNDGGTATASVKFEPKSPLLVLTPQAINLNYCDAADTVTLSLRNDGTGTAFNPTVKVDFGPLAVSNIQGGATYNAGTDTFENIPDIVSGDTFNLQFDVNYADICADSSSGSLLYQPTYYDECNNPFYPTPVTSTYALGGASTSLDVQKTGDATVYIGTTIDYGITVTYNGPLSCGSPANNAGTVTVTDFVPAGFTVADAGAGGNWVPGGDGTGGTIEWTFDPNSVNPFNRTITLNVPDRDQCETACNTVHQNRVDAAVVDCCGCTLTGSDTVTTSIECDQAVILTSSKSSTPDSPPSLGPCETVTITNTYNFLNSALLDNVDLSELEFTEENDNNMQYVPGSISITYPGYAGCHSVSGGTPGNPLQVTFGACASPDSVRNKQLVIEYRMTVTDQSEPQPACGSSYTFYSWSELYLGVDSPTGECLGDSRVHETAQITVDPPAMSVSMTALPSLVENCGVYDVTITVNQDTADVNPYDVRLELENVNYYAVQYLGCGVGVQPTNCLTPTDIGTGVQWDYGDAFAVGADQGTIQLRVQKRCSDAPDLVAHLYYDDLCNDDGDYDDECNTDATTSSLLLLKGDLFIEKTPEVIFAESSQVTWTIYVTNSGDGTASNVSITNTLEAGHQFDDPVTFTVVPDNGDVTTNRVSGTEVNWVIDSMAAGEVRTITVTSNLIACSPLGSQVLGTWGCDYGAPLGTETCETEGPVSAGVELPTPNLVSTSLTVSPQDMCSTQVATITLRNAGQMDVHDIVIAETLPAGLSYAGNPQFEVNNSGTWIGTDAPTIANVGGQEVLTWSYLDDPASLDTYLETLSKGDILKVRFDMTAACDFSGGSLDVVTQYKNACFEAVTPNSVGAFVLGVRYPEIDVTKTRTSPAAGEPVNCGEQVTWQIEVTNTGAITAPAVWVQDTMDPGYTYDSSTGDGSYMIDNGFNGYGGNARVTTWELKNLPAGQTATLTLTATSDNTGSGDCEDVENVVEAFWGCGNVDNASNTKPGVDGGDSVYCLDTDAAQDTDETTRQPNVDVSAVLTPTSINACGSTTTFTLSITNDSTVASIYNLDAVLTLPNGLSYVDASTNVTACPTTCGAGNPAVDGSTITFYDVNNAANPNNLCDTIGPGQTVTVEFDLASNCYVDGQATIVLRYYDCCNMTQYTQSSTQNIAANEPVITIDKSPDTAQIDCGLPNQQSWTITVTNTGNSDAQVVRIVDTPGSWITVDTAASTAGIQSLGGGRYGWEINNLERAGQPGDTTTFTLVGSINPGSNDCDDLTLRQNDVYAEWACGVGADATDGDPRTTGYDCTYGTVSDTDAVTLQMPNLQVTRIEPEITCDSDGNLSGSITVRVWNSGNGSTLSAFDVQVTDGQGWTGRGTRSTPIPAAGARDITIDVTGWSPTCLPCGSGYSFTATADIDNDICECNEGDNVLGPQDYDVPIADLAITDIDFSNVVCTGTTLSGNVEVTVQNQGCANAGAFEVSLGTDGCLSFSNLNVASLNQGASTTLQFPVTGSWADCGDDTCAFTATIVDTANNVCECGTGNNSLTRNYTSTMPDLVVGNIDYSGLTCTTEGIEGSVDVTVTNQGFGPTVNNFQVSLGSDGCLTFDGNRTVNAPLAAGNSTTMTFNVNSAWSTCNDCSCVLTATVDALGQECECDNGNNTGTATYTNTMPKLSVNNITPSIECDGSGNPLVRLSVEVQNSGCGQADNAVVRLTSACHTFSDQQITLPTNTTDTVEFTFNPDPTDDLCSFTASIDPDGAICECNANNHSYTYNNYSVGTPDLEVQADNLGLSCATVDGQLNITGTLTLVNNGTGSAFTTDIPVRYNIYDNNNCTGTPVATWTSNLTSVNLASDSTPQQFNISSSAITADLTGVTPGCLYSIGVELDYDNNICEYDETNNTHCAGNKTLDIPNIEVTADTLAITPTDDGDFIVSGSVTVSNTGCGNLATDFPVRLTLYSGSNCTGTSLGTWTHTLSPVNINAGDSDTFTIPANTITRDLVADSGDCRVSVLVEADINNDVCEISSDDNDYCTGAITFDIPDLEVDSDLLEISCTGGGEAQVTGSITIANNGCGNNMNDNIPVRFTLYDAAGCSGTQVDQWTETFSSVSIPSTGGTQTFTINSRDISGNFCSGSTNCSMSLLIEVDYNNDIDESDGNDNSRCADIIPNIPDLSVSNVATSIICLEDGRLTGTTVTVTNNGCGDVNGAVIRLASSCGLTFADETVNLAAGESREVLFLFTSGITQCNCTFTATADPDNNICECDEANNTGSSIQRMTMPNVEIDSETLAIDCAGDNLISVTGTVTLSNSGCGNPITVNVPMRITLYSGTGNSGTVIEQWTQDFTGVNLASGGGTQTFTIQPRTISANTCGVSENCQFSVLLEADYSEQICEWDGTDNTLSSDKTSDCFDISVVSANANVTCEDDGNIAGTIAVTIANSGLQPITDDFAIRVDDGKGLQIVKRFGSELNGVLPLAPGTETTLNFNWERNFSEGPLTCSFDTITVQVDPENEICQCSTENDTATCSYELQLPNLRPNAVTIDCSEDGTYSVIVTVENNGCGPASASVLRLEDSLGNTREVSVTALGPGDVINVDFPDWPATCEPATVNFTATIDVNDAVCEMESADNQTVLVYNNPSPDMVITDCKPSVRYAPGKLDGTIEITIQNNGAAPVTTDFQVSVDDGRGWSTTLYYQSDLNGTLPIAVGQTVTVPVKWNRAFNKEPFNCNFNNITVGIDVEAGVCECGTGNNETVVSYAVSIPDLNVRSIQPDCTADGQRHITIVVANDGCGEQREDFNIQVTDSTGNSQTYPFTSLGGTLPIGPGETQTLIVSQWEFDCTNASVDYTVTIDPEGNVSDLNPSNNTITQTHIADEPDLLITDVDWQCNDDGTITFNLTVANQGFGSADNAPVTVYDGDGNVVYNGTVTLAAGAATTVSFTTSPYPKDTDISFRFVADEQLVVCECDGSNNEMSTTVNCPDEGEPIEEGDPKLTITKFCRPGHQQGGIFAFELQVENNGEVDLSDVKVRDYLPEEFQYVTGSSTKDGASITDPLPGPPLEWNIGTLEVGGTATIIFSAVADSDIKQGRYCIDANSAAVYSPATGPVTVDSNSTQCCVVVTRTAGGGCCIRVEESPVSPYRRPEGPMSFIEPYFHTKSFATFNCTSLPEISGKLLLFTESMVK